MPSPTTMAGKKQMMEINCVPECGFMVRDHNQKALVQEALVHVKMVHPDMKMTEQQAMAMIKKV